MFTPHKNPPATVTSPIKAYKQFTIQRAYRGESFFWGLMPQAGDEIMIEFNQPVEMYGYRIRSGNFEHPSDLLYNTSVEIRPVDSERVKESFHVQTDGFITVGRNDFQRGIRSLLKMVVIFLIFLGEFNDLGTAEGKIDAALLGPIAAVRMIIKSASKNWVIISEVKTPFSFLRLYLTTMLSYSFVDHARQW